MTDPWPPPTGGAAPTARRRFLGLAGGGAAAVAAGALVPAAVAGASTPPFARNLRDDFGAVGDGVADDAPALQAAFSSLGSPPGTLGPPQGITGALLLIPPGDYRLGSTVRIHRFAGIVQGAGVGSSPVALGSLNTGLGTVLSWAGPPGDPMFEITDSGHAQIHDLRFFGSDVSPPGAALRFLKDRTQHNQGANSELAVTDCYFGTWPWTLPANRGLIKVGIDVAGTVGDNDQMWISRCCFAGARGEVTRGYRAEHTQSIWGSLSDCVFQQLDVGFESPASCTLVNPQFDRCGVDLRIGSTARINVVGWQSERSGRLADLAGGATLSSTGGACQIDGERMAPGSPMIAAHPSADGQSISLSDMAFTYPRSDAYPDGIGERPDRPDVRVGPSRGTATASGFYVRVRNCLGLDPGQCTLALPLAGSSRGTVEWHSRSDRIHQFRNELRGSGAPGSRSVLDTSAWDPPIPGSS